MTLPVAVLARGDNGFGATVNLDYMEVTVAYQAVQP
jgi:hypothetical protein